KSFLIKNFKDYLLENNIKENKIFITKELKDIIKSINRISKTISNIQKKIIKYYQEVEKLGTSEIAIHYFIKIDRMIQYDIQTQSRQYFKTL
ncbi:8665_t:CDS:2, partial [Gigaspora margarita]